jgi:hypothetical protein
MDGRTDTESFGLDCAPLVLTPCMHRHCRNPQQRDGPQADEAPAGRQDGQRHAPQPLSQQTPVLDTPPLPSSSLALESGKLVAVVVYACVRELVFKLGLCVWGGGYGG